MGAELHDLRTKVSGETHCVLSARSRATGRDVAEIAREILHGWALTEISAASVLQRLLRSEGIAGQSGEGQG